MHSSMVMSWRVNPVYQVDALCIAIGSVRWICLSRTQSNHVEYANQQNNHEKNDDCGLHHTVHGFEWSVTFYFTMTNILIFFLLGYTNTDLRVHELGKNIHETVVIEQLATTAYEILIILIYIMFNIGHISERISSALC